MLKSWRIENFKAIVDSGDLKLAPVTVFAGLNSSGKSSLLQSILMISQTLSNRIADRPLITNGPIVQLGTFRDILNENSSSQLVTFSFEVEWQIRTRIESAKITAQFSSISDINLKPSAIEASKIAVENVFIEFHSIPTKPALISGFFAFSINKIDDAELKKFLENVAQDYLDLVPSVDNQFHYLGEFEEYDEETNSKIPNPYLVALSHFLPDSLVRKVSVEEQQKALLYDTLPDLLSNTENLSISAQKRTFSNINFEFAISDELKDGINKLCEQAEIPERFFGTSFSEFLAWYTELTEKEVLEESLIFSKIYNLLLGSLIKDSSKTFFTNEEFESLDFIGSADFTRAIEQVTQFVTSRIRYLGPLRAEPQAVQGFAPTSEIDDVGSKGQYAAAVYDANKNAQIIWYNPNTQQLEQATLKEALDIWAQYLGVAKQIRTSEFGQSGFVWEIVHKEGQRALPLSAVGVGVSQILPILVMGLLSPKDTLLIVEQPELHLHPQVQARLGDFFVGLSKCNKQCLIETHSENLISQLRYHIVKAGGQDKSECMIYFVDQNDEGAAQFEPIEISPDGNILNWPEGFFDETMLQEDKITAASIKRRAKLVR